MTARLRFLMLMVVAGLAPVQAPAQEDDGTTPASQPLHKSVRSMNAEERRAFWDGLSPEDRQRVLDRRRAVMAGRLDNADYRELTPEENAVRMNKDMEYARDPSAKTELSREERKAVKHYVEASEAKAQADFQRQWKAMTPEQRRAFVQAHRGELEEIFGTQGRP